MSLTNKPFAFLRLTQGPRRLAYSACALMTLMSVGCASEGALDEDDLGQTDTRIESNEVVSDDDVIAIQARERIEFLWKPLGNYRLKNHGGAANRCLTRDNSNAILQPCGYRNQYFTVYEMDDGTFSICEPGSMVQYIDSDSSGVDRLGVEARCLARDLPFSSNKVDFRYVTLSEFRKDGNDWERSYNREEEWTYDGGFISKADSGRVLVDKLGTGIVRFHNRTPQDSPETVRQQQWSPL